MSDDKVYWPWEPEYRRKVMELYGTEDPYKNVPGVPPLPPKPAVVPIRARDGGFWAGDQAWKYHGVTAFSAVYDVRQGNWEKLHRYLNWTQSIGANTWRVFCTWRNLNLRIDDHTIPALVALVDWLNERGTAVHVVTLCDQTSDSPVLISRAEQDAFVQSVDLALANKRTLGELVNEDHKNGRIAARFPRTWLQNMPWTRSAPYYTELPTVPGEYLDWTTSHTPRDEEWPRKAKELLDISRLGWPIEVRQPDGTMKKVGDFFPTHLPAVAGEPINMDEAGRASNYGDYLAVCDLYGAGGCLHGGFASLPQARDAGHVTDLQYCNAPEPGSLGWQVGEEVKRVWTSGMIDADLAVTGRYVRGPWTDCPLEHSDALALRTFAMIAPDDRRAVAVVVRPEPEWEAKTTNGWRIIGAAGNVYRLER